MQNQQSYIVSSCGVLSIMLKTSFFSFLYLVLLPLVVQARPSVKLLKPITDFTRRYGYCIEHDEIRLVDQNLQPLGFHERLGDVAASVSTT